MMNENDALAWPPVCLSARLLCFVVFLVFAMLGNGAYTYLRRQHTYICVF